MMLPRPNYTKLDPFFCKKGGVYIFQSKAFFWGSCLSLFWALGGHFLGPLDGFQNMGGVSKIWGGDLNRGFLAGHRLKIKDNLHMRCQCDSLIIKAPLGSPSLYKKAPW